MRSTDIFSKVPEDADRRPHVTRLLLIGPKPPPSHGTSVKFGTFCEFAAKIMGVDAVDVIDTQTGDKAVTPLLSTASLRGYVRIICQCFVKGRHTDVVVIFGSQRFAATFGSLAVVVFRLMGKPVFVSFFGGAFDVYLSGMRPSLHNAVRKLLGLSNGIFVETRQLEQALGKVWGDMLYYVPNFRLSFPIMDVRAPDDKETVRFLYVGVIRREKGIGELLQAFNSLEKRLKENETQIKLQLDLYGPVYNSPEDRVDFKSEKGQPNIHFHGEAAYEHVLTAYSNADIFVYPSYWRSEGHSGAVLEALMAGLPVIAADWRATPELVRDGENGLLCPPRDSETLSLCMERLVCDPMLRHRLAANTQRSVAEYDAENACAKMMQLIVGKNEIRL